MEPFEPETSGAQTGEAQTVSAVPGHPPEDRPSPGGFWRRALAYLADLFLIDLVVIFLLAVRLLAVDRRARSA